VTSARDVVGMCLDLVVSGVDTVRMEPAESALWGDSVTASDPYPSDPGLGAPICAVVGGLIAGNLAQPRNAASTVGGRDGTVTWTVK
jgi:hypothetical protein